MRSRNASLFLLLRKLLPLRLVRVRDDDAVERNRGESFGALEVAFLRRRQQRMQHLDRRLEHLDELEQALVGEAQAAGIAVGVRIVLREAVELADVDLADQRRDVLVVLVARLGLGDRDLAQHRRLDAHDAELRDVAVEFLQALDRPRRHDAGQVAARDAVVGFQHVAVLARARTGPSGDSLTGEPLSA